MWIEPIYNRTQADVDLIKLDPTNENNKGAYNFNDLNRVESNCEFVMNILNDSGLIETPIVLEIKKDWNVLDIPTIENINRIRQNIITLMDNIIVEECEEIELSGTMNYIKANILEKNLTLIKDVIESFKKEFRYCNQFYCGVDGLGLCTSLED